MRYHITVSNGIIGLLLCSILFSFISHKENVKYLQKPTISIDESQAQTLLLNYVDTLSHDSLFGVMTNENIPIHYFQHITTDVCFDNECRLLNITVYWNITGRYLGFELKNGEFLSKRDHEPFSDEEYQRLHELLADSELSLGGISFEKLIEIPESKEHETDGVTGATTQAVSQIVVKGAAYTTYTLWNIVHGHTKDWVIKLTEEQLSPDLMDMILKSPDLNDKIWGLHRVNYQKKLPSHLAQTILNMISGEDFYLAYSAIRALKVLHLNSDTLQVDLFSKYQMVDHSIQSMIVQKLMDAPYLSSNVIINSRSLLEQLNGKQLGDMLKLYTKHSVKDLETCQAVANILKNENRFVSGKAYTFLKKASVTDKGILKSLANYEQKK